jgi:hypothetical protein
MAFDHVVVYEQRSYRWSVQLSLRYRLGHGSGKLQGIVGVSLFGEGRKGCRWNVSVAMGNGGSYDR